MDENILGKRLRWLRTKKDIHQKKVAKDLGLTPFQLSRYENGKSKPDPQLIAAFADYYGATTDYLLGRTEHPSFTEGMSMDDKVEELMKIIESMPEKRRKEMEERILAYAKGLADANKEGD